MNAQLVRDVLTHDLLARFLSAYDAALALAQEKDNPNVPQFSIMTPGIVDQLNARSMTMQDVQNRPKHNIEGVADVLVLEKNMAAGRVPGNAAPGAIQAYANQLIALVR